MPESSDVIGKIGGTILLILVVIFSNAFIMASFPQHFLANSDTIFNFNVILLSFQR